MEQDFLAYMLSVSEGSEEENDENIEYRNHEVETFGHWQGICRDQSETKKEIVFLDDKKRFNGNGDEEESVQKEEPKFQIVEDFDSAEY